MSEEIFPTNEDKLISVVIRFHNPAMLPFLEEALFSLSVQDWDGIEPVIVLQNGTPELRDTIERLIRRQPWAESPRYQILCKYVPQGVDGRSALMNLGIQQAKGRYLAFLDYDDIVYQHIYSSLIQQLRSSDSAMAVGGCRLVRLGCGKNHWFIETKVNFFAPFVNKTRIDLFKINFIPIHSYVIDRYRTAGFDLHFDENLSRGEDYDFLMRFCSRFNPDLTLYSNLVCEHRLRTDGSNTVHYFNESVADESQAAWDRDKEIIERKKSQYEVRLSMGEIMDVCRLSEQWEKERDEFGRKITGLAQALEQLRRDHDAVTYRVARKARNLVRRVPLFKRLLKGSLARSLSTYRRAGSKLRSLIGLFQ